MAEVPAFRRVLLKLSGEALMGDDAYGINRAMLQAIVAEIAGVAALIALIGEVLVAVDVFDATIDSGFNTTNATIISIVACVLWAIVVLMSCRG